MNEYLAIFQIGPVQEFIKTAKKTIDYWSGSFLLSYLSATAISIIGEDKVIFPSVDKNPLYDEVKKQRGDIPWNRGAGIPDSAYHPTLPNRIFCIFNDEPKAELEKAKGVVIEQWKKIVSAVEKAFPAPLTKEIKESNEWNKIWTRQTENPFEILYVWRLRQDGEGYGEAYKKTENLMGMRKACRWFDAKGPEPGHKCSLCGIREALHLASGDLTRREIRKEWNKKVRKQDLTYGFREGETLCAVCMVKRLAPGYAFKNNKGIPSTSTIAVGKTVLDIVEKLDPKGLIPKIKKFTDNAKDLARDAKEPISSCQLPKVENKAKEKGLYDVLNIDGDWFFYEFYHKMAQRPGYKHIGSQFLYGQRLLRDNVLGPLKEVLGRERYKDPCKYYAVVVADGDSMGKRLGSIESSDQHKKLSQCIAQFSTTVPAKIFEEDHLGFVVYFGGDEGVAFIALEDLFSTMEGLRNKWQEEVIEPLKEKGIDAPTLSVGVAIAHHQEGLRGVIERAFSVIETAKGVWVRSRPGLPPKEKDAFSVSLSRRSSGKSISRVRWDMPGSPSALECLKQLVDAYCSDALSWAWIDELYREREAIGDPPAPKTRAEEAAYPLLLKKASSICQHEIKRTMDRHKKRNGTGASVNKIIGDVCRLHNSLEDLGSSAGDYGQERFENFINLMDLARYIAKGGGR